MPLNENIKTLREQDGISLGRLSELTGISKGYLSQIESGQIKSPSAVVVQSIASAFRVSMDLLMGEAVAPAPPRQKYTFLLTVSESASVYNLIAELRAQSPPPRP